MLTVWFVQHILMNQMRTAVLGMRNRLPRNSHLTIEIFNMVDITYHYGLISYMMPHLVKVMFQALIVHEVDLTDLAEGMFWMIPQVVMIEGAMDRAYAALDGCMG